MTLSGDTSEQNQAIPMLYGMVLAGGLSTRMQEDKASIIYRNNVTQRNFCCDILSEMCERVFVSGRVGQTFTGVSNSNILWDAGESKGPLSAILAAFQNHPQVAWLFLACDLPYIDAHEIRHLISLRDPQKVATAFMSPTDQLPEPLVAIWEPKSFQMAKINFEKGILCPRKLLIKSDVKLIHPLVAQSLINANVPAERDTALEFFSAKNSLHREAR